MINYRKGDATRPVVTNGYPVIVHICNDVGGWGKGFVLAVEKRFPWAKNAYKGWYKESAGERTLTFPEFGSKGDRVIRVYESGNFELGEWQLVQSDSIAIANLIAQQGINWRDNVPPIRYKALRKTLAELAESLNGDVSIHMPRIGCGLAGGNWEHVESIIEETLKGFDVNVYDLG